LGVDVASVKIAIWGNHSPTMVPDIDNATVDGQLIRELGLDKGWLEGEFIQKIQQRGTEVMKARGASSAASAAQAIACSLQTLYEDQPLFSMGILAEKNPYGIANDLIYSFPCRREKGKISILSGLKHSAYIHEKIKASEKELKEERDAVRSYLRG
jgi:malate/lactate dehydrogenase